MVERSQVAAGKEIHRRTGRTFYYATRLLPGRVRHATYVLYAFFRVADEVVDDAGDTEPAVQRRRLRAICEAALGGDPPEGTLPPDSREILAAFSELRERYDIPDEEVEAFVEAMLADTETARYRSYEDLETYMRGSAAAVGAMMTYVMVTDPEVRTVALEHARRLGEAFQLTNFLRDVGEDVRERDRVYLPGETLERHGVTHEQVERLEYDEAFAAAVGDELRRAERLYREGVAGIQYLPGDCQLPVVTAAVLYADHHRLIRAREGDVLSHTPSLSATRKLALVARTWLSWRLHRDPATVFEKVAALPSAGKPLRSEPGEPFPAR